MPNYVLGIDYGTDSCRAVIIDAKNGNETISAISIYPRWSHGLYCNPVKNQFRQHPRDYIDSLISVMEQIYDKTGNSLLPYVMGIAIDTTGSTPCLITENIMPLAMLPEYENNPDAMFILWKDHTATDEAVEITRLARSWNIDYTIYEGGVYSSEWFWAKLLHVARTNPDIIKAGFSAIEHCDWMPALLSGTSSLKDLKRSRCAMGHKAMWHESFGGYPSDLFFSRLNPELVRIKNTLYKKTYTSDTVFGSLTEEWAAKLHLRKGIPIAVGAFDAHMGAVGGGVAEGVLVKVMGTSTCDMIIGPQPSASIVTKTGQDSQIEKTEQAIEIKKEHIVRGICGQVDGSIIPGMIGYEAGQSAFGDVYAWLKSVLMWPILAMRDELFHSSMKFSNSISGSSNNIELEEGIIDYLDRQIMTWLENEATKIDPQESGVLAVDWLNGRRTPDANQKLKGAIIGLTLGTTAPMLYRALIEATAYSARAILERFEEEGIAISRVRGIGGVARKSSLVMQIVADVLGKPIEIVASDQSVALGTAIFAAVAAGFYESIPEAQIAMAPAIETVIHPNMQRTACYDKLYKDYIKLGTFIEKEFT